MKIVLPALLAGATYAIHVDKDRLARNRELADDEVRLPIIRVLAPDGTFVHCHHVEWSGSATLRTDYEHPLIDRPTAICVIRTSVALTLDT